MTHTNNEVQSADDLTSLSLSSLSLECEYLHSTSCISVAQIKCSFKQFAFRLPFQTLLTVAPLFCSFLKMKRTVPLFTYPLLARIERQYQVLLLRSSPLWIWCSHIPTVVTVTSAVSPDTASAMYHLRVRVSPTVTVPFMDIWVLPVDIRPR